MEPSIIPTNPPSSASPHVVIVGGGITGLSAAYYLEQAAAAAGLTLRYTLIEREARLGGKVLTEQVDDCLVEGGPDSFVTQKPWAVSLIKELDLEAELIGTKSARRATYVLTGGQLCPLPDGLQLLVPTRIWPFLTSPLFSPRGRLRMLLETLIPPRRDSSDESLAAFVSRRFGAEAVDKLGEPLLAGIHSSDVERQSMLATFPRFREIEARHGSLILGMRAALRARTPGQAVGSAFLSLRGGIGALPAALARRLTGTVLMPRAVTALHYSTSTEQPYALQLDDGSTLWADALIMTAPAAATARLVAPWSPQLAAGLRELRTVSTGTITLAYRRSEVGQPLAGFGLVIPGSERRQINAVTITTNKFAYRAPDEIVLVRVFVGGTRTPQALALDDTRLVALARAELRGILGISAAPLWQRVFRWVDANPQYDVGHFDRLERIARFCPPGLLLSGCSYHGVGLPDCINAGRQAAEQAVALVRQRGPTVVARGSARG